MSSEAAEFESRVRVISKVRRADEVVAVEVAAVDGGLLPGWTPGAHVDLVLDGVETRQYSLCGDSADRSSYRLAVLRAAGGRGTSRFVHDILTVGDEAVIRGPRNHFSLDTASHYLFIAGGIGITPILPMVRHAERAGADWRLVYGGRRRSAMAFLDEISVYGDRVEICPQDEIGLLDLDRLLAPPGDDGLVYCCGPEPLLAAAETRCANWVPHALRLERFTPRQVAAERRETAFEVELAQSNLVLEVPAGISILEVVRAAGVTVPSSCEEGVCGSCETILVEGEADHRDSVLDADEQSENAVMMICVSRARSPRLVLDL